MTLALPGWGSLIWDPRDLAIESDWHPDGPQLPVEFARISSRDRLTLVLVADVPLQTTLWAVSRKTSLEAAAADLEAREGCTDPSGIAIWPHMQGRSSVRKYDEEIRNWAVSRGLDGVVWTALGPKGPSGERLLASETERLEYLRGLVTEGREKAAREYIERAPAQIETPFRALVRRELGWGRNP